MTENQICVIKLLHYSFTTAWLGSKNGLMTGLVSFFGILANPFSQTQVQGRGNQSSHTKPANQ